MITLVKLDNRTWIDPDSIESITQPMGQLVTVGTKSGDTLWLHESQTLDMVLDRLKDYKLQLSEIGEFPSPGDEMRIARDEVLRQMDEAIEKGMATQADLKRWVNRYFGGHKKEEVE